MGIKKDRFSLLCGILAILLGIITLLMDWIVPGNLIFGIPAILLAIYSFNKGHTMLGIVAIIITFIGILGTILMIINMIAPV